MSFVDDDLGDCDSSGFTTAPKYGKQWQQVKSEKFKDYKLNKHREQDDSQDHQENRATIGDDDYLDDQQDTLSGEGDSNSESDMEDEELMNNDLKSYKGKKKIDTETSYSKVDPNQLSLEAITARQKSIGVLTEAQIKFIDMNYVKGFGYSFKDYAYMPRNGVGKNGYIFWHSLSHSDVSNCKRTNHSGLTKSTGAATYRSLDHMYLMFKMVRSSYVPSVEAWILLTIWRATLGGAKSSDLMPAAECYFLIKHIENEVWWNNCFKYHLSGNKAPPFYVHITDQIEANMNKYKYKCDGQFYIEKFADDSKEAWQLYKAEVLKHVTTKWVPKEVYWISDGVKIIHKVNMQFISDNYYADYKMLGRRTICTATKLSPVENTFLIPDRGASVKLSANDILSIMPGWYMKEIFPIVDQRLCELGKTIQSKKGNLVKSFTQGRRVTSYTNSSIKHDIFVMENQAGHFQVLKPRHQPDFTNKRFLPQFKFTNKSLIIEKPVGIYPGGSSLLCVVPDQVIFVPDTGFNTNIFNTLCLCMNEVPTDIIVDIGRLLDQLVSRVEVKSNSGDRFISVERSITVDNGTITAFSSGMRLVPVEHDELLELVNSAVYTMRKNFSQRKKDKNSKNKTNKNSKNDKNDKNPVNSLKSEDMDSLRNIKFKPIMCNAFFNNVYNLLPIYGKQYDVKAMNLCKKIYTNHRPKKSCQVSSSEPVPFIRCMDKLTGRSGILRKVKGVEFEIIPSGCEPDNINESNSYSVINFSRNRGYNGDCFFHIYFGVLDYFTLLDI